MHNIRNINARFLHEKSGYIILMQRNNTSFMQEQYLFRAGTIDLTRTIYIWDTHGLYIVDRPSVFSKQTVCFSFIRVVYICVLRYLSVECRFSFVSFRSSLPSDGNIAFSLCIKSKVSHHVHETTFLLIYR